MDDETLRRLVRSETHGVPGTRAACPSAESLQSAVTAGGDDASRWLVLEHVATCALCRRDFDLLRTADAAASAVAAPATRLWRVRWMSGLAAASVIVALSLLAPRATDDPMRGSAADAPSDVELLPPARRDAGLTLRWRAVPDAVTYRVEVTDDDGNVAFSAETSDTTVAAPALDSPTLRWTVQARRLDGAVLNSSLDVLTVPR